MADTDFDYTAMDTDYANAQAAYTDNLTGPMEAVTSALGPASSALGIAGLATSIPSPLSALNAAYTLGTFPSVFSKQAFEDKENYKDPSWLGTFFRSLTPSALHSKDYDPNRIELPRPAQGGDNPNYSPGERSLINSIQSRVPGLSGILGGLPTITRQSPGERDLLNFIAQNIANNKAREDAEAAAAAAAAATGAGYHSANFGTWGNSGLGSDYDLGISSYTGVAGNTSGSGEGAADTGAGGDDDWDY